MPGLTRYVAKRILIAIPTLLAVMALNFAIIRLAPGGPEAMLMNPKLPPSARIQILKTYGLDKPLATQFLLYFSEVLLHGNLGTSYFYSTPVIDLIMQRLPNTLLLMGTSLILTMIIGIPLGVFSATRPNSKSDRAIVIFSNIGWAMPPMWLGLILLLVFVLYLPWFPAGGIQSIGASGYDILDRLWHLVLPSMCLSVGSIANINLFVRSSLLDVLKQEYILAARGKGLDQRTVLYRHALRNGLLPVVTNIGLSIAFMVGGALVIETIFTWPGLGLLTFEAIVHRDYPLLLGLFFILSLVVIVMNLVTDILYAILDPRISY
jgi:peptide/nickel transport system permease protein